MTRSLLVLFIALLLASCASRIPPSGGPKDTKPPEVLRATPENGSTGFSGNLITLDFSEYIQVKNGPAAFLVSPPLQSAPQINLKGKTVQIRLNEKLKENTTYSLIAGNAITDLTEGNPMKEYSLVFSTGESLDSLVLEGYVYDAFTGNSVENALVMLYGSMNDTLPEKSLPIKLARTDASGRYQISHIREGKYMAFALQDANNNYRYDLPEEKTGFLDIMLLIAPGKIRQTDFRISVNPQKRQRLLDKTFSPPGKITLQYAKPVSKWEIRLSDGQSDSSWLSSFRPDNDSLIAWLPRPKKDSLLLYSITVSDSIRRTDTLFFKTTTSLSKRSGRGSNSRADTSLQFRNNIEGGKRVPGDTLTIISTRPLRSIDPKQMILLKGKDTLSFAFKPLLNHSRMQVLIGNLPDVESNYSMLLLPGAFYDDYGASNDTLKWNFQNYLKDELGSFSMEPKGKLSAGSWYWEFTDTKGNIILKKPYINGEPFRISNLIPGKYRIRVFLDQNNNQQWDHGDFYRKIQPEKIRHYPSEINMRAGWDLEQSWELND